MSANRKLFEIKQVLDSLRADVGDSEFGYRMQALFAHVLIALGGQIIEINQQGHPDIVSEIDGKKALSQVKTISHSGADWSITINPEDIAGIRPTGPNEVGYFVILDCAVPVSWILSDYEKIRRHESRSVNIETIRASADVGFSSECSEIFADLITEHRKKLHLLTYSVLRQRALRGEGL